MAPKMEPGGLFMTSSSALARQEAARRPNRQQKRYQDRPKSAKSRFQANLGGARSAKVAYADYADNRAKRRFRRINVRFRVATGGTYRGNEETPTALALGCLTPMATQSRIPHSLGTP